jgi:hypothetical protein
MLIPGTYIPWLFIAIIVLAPVFEFVAYVVDLIRAEPTSVDERTNPKLDRRVLVRLGVAGGAAAFLLIVGMTAAYVIRPDSLGSVLLWPLKHPFSLLFGGVGLYLVVLLCGVRPRQPVLLLCLALPGLVAMPLLLLAYFALSQDAMEALAWAFFALFVEPAAWILLFIALGQARHLRKRGGDFTAGGLARVFFISFAYLVGIIS